nr:AHS alpha [Echiniscus testudo]
MNRAFIAVLCAMLVGCALALQLPDVKDQTDKPIDPKQIKNATLTFYNNGTYIYMLEVPCEAYLGGRGGSQQRSQQRSQSSGSNAHDEEDDEHEDDEDANGSSQMTAQQRQRQQQQQQQRQQQQSGRSSRQTAGGSQADHHMNPDELRQAHEGTECECKCKNQEGEELEDIITVTMGGKGGSQQSSSSQRGGQRSQQQRQQQQRQQQQRQQRASGAGGASSHGHEEGEGPELVYPTQPRPGQKCIFFEEGEWENDDDGEYENFSWVRVCKDSETFINEKKVCFIFLFSSLDNFDLFELFPRRTHRRRWPRRQDTW